ncbi:MAG: hypothetical protein CMJ20_01680 [Phycisphaeraceae bacterium]|nr:hypothetical protein [Phycisphaeraceae bacterium]|tara:strand:+ start:479 stop:1039 length:561 start_codon:yes stop_codon:yes gene_type:complete
MTPKQLLEDVKARFPVLLHEDEKALLSLLKKALAKYQELAGFSDRHRIRAVDASDSCELPPLFLSKLSLKDKEHRFINSTVWDGNLELELDGDEVFPLTLSYLKNVLESDFDTFQLPSTSISLLGDYLELLITIPNSERIRQVSTAGKMDTSGLPAETDLATRRDALEAQMRSNRAMIPPISLLGG